MNTEIELDNLNIDHNNKILAIKALGASKTLNEAADLLGITTRTIYTWMKIYKIYFDGECKITKDNFNIKDNNKKLVIKALDRTETYKEAADLIGISKWTLYNWMKLYNIPIDENRVVSIRRRKKTNNL
jgi:transposase